MDPLTLLLPSPKCYDFRHEHSIPVFLLDGFITISLSSVTFLILLLRTSCVVLNFAFPTFWFEYFLLGLFNMPYFSAATFCVSIDLNMITLPFWTLA